MTTNHRWAVRNRSDRSAQRWFGYALVAPTLVLFAMFFVWPLARALQFSLYDYSGLGAPSPESFVGVENFVRAFTDPELWAGFARNILFAFINLFGSLVVGSLLAYQLYRRVRGWRALQIALFVPHIVPVVVVALLWRFILQPGVGLLDQTLAFFGVGAGTNLWLGQPQTAALAVGLVWSWTLIPFAMLIIFVGMLRTPEELVESARLEGASEFQTLWHVILPLVRPTLWLVAALVIMASFRGFDLIFLMTQGGPGYATSTPALYTYRQAFEFNEYGYASALGFVIALMLALILPIAGRQMRKGTVEL